MKDEIFSKIKTTESAQVLQDEMELLERSLYLGSSEFTSVLKTKVRADVSEYIKGEISKDGVDIKAFITNLTEKLSKIPKVSLILAFEPSEDAIDKFYSFVLGACGEPILMDIGYSPDIIGGAVIIYKGRYRDFSFKRVFEKEFETQREVILKSMEK